MSKGGNRRAMNVSQDKFAENWERIFGKKKKKRKTTTRKKKKKK